MPDRNNLYNLKRGYDATLADLYADNVYTGGISEAVADAGVTIDGALILDGTVPTREARTLAAADGAISAKDGTVVITKAGVAVLTLAAPTAGTDDGKVLTIIASTAHAHTVTQTTPGFNGAGTAGDVATFGGAIGDNMTIIAYNGVWLVKSLRNVTLG